MNSECPEKSALYDLASGRLPADRNVELSRHVDSCESCRATFAAFNTSALETLLPEADDPDATVIADPLPSLRFVPGENAGRLSEDFQAATQQFESRLKQGAAADVPQCLRNLGIDPDSPDLPAQHVILLLELLHIELQYAWAQKDNADKQSSPNVAAVDISGRPTTDQFVQQFPILRKYPLLVADLARQEAVIRGFQMDLAPTQDSDQPFGIEQFDLIEPIASGGMGVVWKAQNRELGRVVAVKLIQQNKIVGNPERQQLYQQRFLVEAQAAARLTHPNIVPIHSIHNSAGQLYYEMDLIEGGSLRDLIRNGATVSPQQAVETMLSIAQAIDHAHRRGVIHRDLKPENILMKDGKVPMVTDFGLAKLVDTDTALTQDDTAMGTMNYMAPEQFRDAASVTVAADIYSLGTMLYELLSGTVPIAYQGDMSSFSNQVQNVDPLPPQRSDRSVSRDIQNVCLKCLAKPPHERYVSAGQLADDLQCFLDGRAVSARRVGPFGHFWRLCLRYPRTASLAGGLVLALVLGFAVSVKFMFDARHQASLALGTVNQFYLQIDQNDAFRQPAFNDLRVRLMKEGRQRLDELTYAPVYSRDRSNRRAIATLHFINARSLQASEQSEAAFAEFRRAGAIQRQLVASDPDDLDALADLATTLIYLEELLPRDDQAPQWLSDAQDMRERIAAELSDDDSRKPKALRVLANVFMNKANRLAEPIIQRRVRPTPDVLDEALRLFRKSNDLRTQAMSLPSSQAVDAGEQDALARDTIVGKANMAALLSQLEDSTLALDALRDASSALEFYLQSHPWDVEARHQYAECQLSLYVMADVKTAAEFTAIDEAEQDAEIVVAMIPHDLRAHRTVARIALERSLERIVPDLDFAIEQNAESLAPARLNPLAVQQLHRAFEHLPADSDATSTTSELSDRDLVTAVRLARTLKILTPLQGVSSTTGDDADELRQQYLDQIQTARQHLYQPPPNAPQITQNDFHESRIWMLAYSAVVAHLQYETTKRDQIAQVCLTAIDSRRQLGHDSDDFTKCETIVQQLLQQP